MKNKLLALMLLLSSSLLCMEKEKEKYVWRPKKKQEMSFSVKEKTIEITDEMLDVFHEIEPLIDDMSNPKVKNIVEDFIFNKYKDKPDTIISLINIANELISSEGEEQKLGEVIKAGCINFIANTALRMSEINNVSMASNLYHGPNNSNKIPRLFYSTYNEFTTNWARWFNSDEDINLAKQSLDLKSRQACCWLESLLLSPEDSELVAASIFEENLNEITEKLYYEGLAPYFSITTVQYSPDDTQIALGSDEGIIINKGNNKIQFGCYGAGKVTALRFFPQDSLIAAAYQKTPAIGIYKYDEDCNENILERKSYSSAYPLCFYEQGFLGSNFDSGLKRVYSNNIHFKEIKPEVLIGHTAVVLSLSNHSDGKRTLSGSADKTVRLWDVATQSSECRALPYEITDVSFSPVDQHTFITAGENTNVWDIRTKDPVLQLPERSVTVDQSPDGTQLLIAGNIGDKSWFGSNGIMVYDITKFKRRQEYYLDPTVKEARFSPKANDKLFTRYADGNMQLWVLGEDDQYINMDRRNFNPRKDFKTTTCAYSNNGEKITQIGHFARTSRRNPARFTQGSTLIEHQLSDKKKRALGIGISAERALEMRYTQAVKEQAQDRYQPRDY